MDYWRPVCHLTGQEAAGEIVAPVAGVTGVGYGLVERLSRADGGVVERETLRLEQAGEDFEPVKRVIGAARPALAGLQLDVPRIMGIVNVTPDSFFDGGQHGSVDDAVAGALELQREGADILDVGGESTRPGAAEVPVQQELDRVIPVIEALAARTEAVISIDTRKAAVMEAAVAAGARLINDVSALSFDERSVSVAAKAGVGVVLMHAQGTPQTMQDKPHYNDVVTEVYDYLQGRVEVAVAGGVKREALIVDPGIGFGKTTAHNAALLSSLSVYHGLGVPLLLGCSRKSFIGALSAGEDAEERLPGSLAGALLGACQGVQILRVHDVAATQQALSVMFAGIERGEG